MVTVADGSSAGNTDLIRLKTELHRQIIDLVDFSRAEALTEAELRAQLKALAEYLCARQPVTLSETQRERLVLELMDEIYGFGPIESLMVDPAVSDILINGPDRVLVERRGVLEETGIRFADSQHLMQFIHRLVGRAGRRIDESSPMVDARLPDGSRFNAIIPPLSLGGATVSIRRFGNQRIQMENLVQFGTMAPTMADFLVLAVQGRMNVIVSGGTGAGKTTLLNCMSRYISDSQRVVTIEETAELNLQQRDVVSLETRLPNLEGRGAVTQRDLLRNALRMRPDRIIVGEARGSEVLEMLQAMNTGHDGSMSTVHANDARETLDRLELMIALAGVELPSRIARQYICNAVDIVIHVTRLHTGERRVTRISEVSGLKDGEWRMDDIFVYRLSGESRGGRPVGAFYATGYQPVALRRLASAMPRDESSQPPPGQPPRAGHAERLLQHRARFCRPGSAPARRPHSQPR